MGIFTNIFAVIGVVLLLSIIYSFFKKKEKSYELGKVQLLKNKVLQFATPHKTEKILLFLYVTFFLWWDVLQNKVLDLGVDYRVTWWGTTTSSALDLGIVILILFHLTLMALFLMSLKSKATNSTYDVIVGIMAFFGVAIILSGFVNEIYSPTIRFLFIDMPSTTYYHIGVLIEFLAGLYWALTK
jgi:steroid 5-alpha reductase family enzyme